MAKESNGIGWLIAIGVGLWLFSGRGSSPTVREGSVQQSAATGMPDYNISIAPPEDGSAESVIDGTLTSADTWLTKPQWRK